MRNRTPLVVLTVMALGLTLLSVRAAGAQEVPSSETVGEVAITPEDDSTAPGLGRKILNTGAALGPGLIVHGAGHFAAGDSDTGWFLLGVQGVGLGAIVAGGAVQAITGASKEIVTPVSWLIIEGGGLLFLSMLADLYGVAAPDGGTGRPVLRAPDLRLELGYMNVTDPIFDYQNFVTTAALWRWKGLRVAPEAQFATDDDNWRARFMFAWRLTGPRPDQRAEDGSFLDIDFGYTHHRYGTERLTEHTFEASINGRLDLDRVAPSMKGAFAETGLGYAMGAYTYDGIDTEATELLLGHFAFGFYTGHSAEGWGEVALFYDHRHDGFAAGSKIPWAASGVSGHVGLRGEFSLWSDWGVGFEMEAGSAYVAGASLLYQMGGER